MDDRAKKMRALNKKLKAIVDLQAKVDEGRRLRKADPELCGTFRLTDEQRVKIGTKDDLQEQLEEYEAMEEDGSGLWMAPGSPRASSGNWVTEELPEAVAEDAPETEPQPAAPPPETEEERFGRLEREQLERVAEEEARHAAHMAAMFEASQAVEAEAAPVPAPPTAPEPAAAAAPPEREPDGPEKERAKKMRALVKKLKAIDDLQAKMRGGTALKPEQMAKLKTRPALQQEIEALEEEAKYAAMYEEESNRPESNAVRSGGDAASLSAQWAMLQETDQERHWRLERQQLERVAAEEAAHVAHMNSMFEAAKAAPPPPKPKPVAPQPAPEPEPAPETEPEPDGPEEVRAKKMRAVTKKLKAIDDLQAKMRGGTALKPEQMAKLKTRPALQQEIDALEEEAKAAAKRVQR